MKKVPALLMIPFALAAGLASAARPPAATLDLTPPNFLSAKWQDKLQGPTVEEMVVSEESVVVTPSPNERWNTRFSPMGIGALFWAALNPAQAWKVVLPVQPGDEFVADSHVQVANCTTTGQVANSVTYCP